MPKTDIFLSYARTDRATARMFAQALVDEGFAVWWDASLHSGETFDEVIERNLREAKAVVVLWSPASVASRWVRAEATLAHRRDKLVPAMIEPCDRPIIFELTHAAELSDWTGDLSDARWQSFVDDLRRMVVANTDGDVDLPPVTAPPKAPAQPAELAEARPQVPAKPSATEAIPAVRIRRAADDQAEPEEPLVDSEVHCLEIEHGDLIGDPIVIESSGVKIGRTAPADIVLPHQSVSREHCVVGLANDELLVTDLNSTNGTYVDDVRISRATILPVGSVLRLGQVTLRHAVRSGTNAAGSDSVGDAKGRLQSGRFAAAS